MPWKEATFWIGITVFGTGLYFLVDYFEDRASKVILWMAGVLCLIGATAVGYSIYAYYVPSIPKPPFWVGMLILTWALIGFDLYQRARDKRMGTTTASDDKGLEIKDNDPRIYLIAIRDRRDRVPPGTPFVVKNRGKHVAHRIHIAKGQLKLGYRTVGFVPVDNLGAEDEAEILPWTGNSSIAKHDIFHVLMEDVEARAKAKGERVLPENFGLSFVITHESFDGHKFEVAVDVVFKVTKYLYRSNHPDSAAAFPEDISEIRHSKFRRLS